jgi:putative ABC transport system ATP-binding protein
MSVSVRQVTKEYPMGKLVVQALKGINLEIGEGEFTTVAGASGCGKTTLLNLIGCVDIPSSGSIYIDGIETSPLSDRELTSLRLHKLGFIFQGFNLIPVLSVRQNIEFPLLLLGDLTQSERAMKVDALIDRVGLQQQRNNRSNELSGGQRQRVAIARALVTNPKIVLADEPTANLDSENGRNVIDLMKELNVANKTTFIFSTHDPAVVKQAKRVIRLSDGLVVKEEFP